MKICVFGAGAIGGHLAARLAHDGHEVSVVARPAAVAGVATRGMTLIAGDTTIQASVKAFTHAGQAGVQDLVVVTLKSNAVALLGDSLSPLLQQNTIVLFVVNGFPWWYPYGLESPAIRIPSLKFLDADGALRRSLGIDRVIGGVMHSGNSVETPGVVVNDTPGTNALWLGEVNGSLSGRVERLASVFGEAGLPTTAVVEIRQQVWRKLMRSNIANMAICLLSDRALGVMRSNRRLLDVARGVLAEGVAIAEAHGYPLESDFDTAYIAMIVASAAHKSSMLQDYERGRPLELDATLVAAQLFARAANVSTPYLDTVTAFALQKAANAGLYTLDNLQDDIALRLGESEMPALD